MLIVNWYPKMDGLFHGKPYFLMDDLGGPPLFLETRKFKFPVVCSTVFMSIAGWEGGDWRICIIWFCPLQLQDRSVLESSNQPLSNFWAATVPNVICVSKSPRLATVIWFDCHMACGDMWTLWTLVLSCTVFSMARLQDAFPNSWVAGSVGNRQLHAADLYP